MGSEMCIRDSVSEDGIRSTEHDLVLANFGTIDELRQNLNSIVDILRARAAAA